MEGPCNALLIVQLPANCQALLQKQPAQGTVTMVIGQLTQATEGPGDGAPVSQRPIDSKAVLVKCICGRMVAAPGGERACRAQCHCPFFRCSFCAISRECSGQMCPPLGPIAPRL